MKPKWQKISDAIHDVSWNLEQRPKQNDNSEDIQKLEEAMDFVCEMGRRLSELEQDKARLDWLLGGAHGAVKYVSLSSIDDAYDERILVKTRKDIDAEILADNKHTKNVD